MTFELFHDPETFGLAFYWNGPWKRSDGKAVHPALSKHRLTLVLGTIVIGIEWS